MEGRNSCSLHLSNRTRGEIPDMLNVFKLSGILLGFLMAEIKFRGFEGYYDDVKYACDSQLVILDLVLQGFFLSF